MVLVTGATGNIGSAPLEGLHRDGVRPLRGLTRDAARAGFPDGVEAVEADLARPAALGNVFSGVEALFLVTGICTEAAVVRAARRAGVRHVVLVSSITAQAHRRMTPFLGARTAAAVLDPLGDDVNDELLKVRGTVEEITGSPGRTFRQWATENASAFGPA
ncbi:SDR family oxidoreductase [Streptomyces sp. Wb2n-11]|uniref:SDR family oxidoreductase n=1 Tax=Streptomyces sp. Wb2n-11 TaxID=1030533 RepID=UPI000A452D05|nr:NAD(P)H-binding protein [Streptomyces sp. Wb2n-11]